MGIKQFRYDIGFLRAIAVISVLFFHFKVPFFDGGFLGVDIFFVISGYLMTRIVLNGFTRNNFSLKEFYLKRVKRIFPVLIVVGFVILLVSILLFLNKDAAQNAKNVVFSSMFISNIYYWLYNGYFDSASQGNIFLHSWSLSVEWQFYLVYPLLLLVVKRFYLNNRKAFNIGFLGFTLISLVLCLWVTQFDNSFAFYMFPTRAWEMTIGGIAFLYATPLENKFEYNLRRAIVIIGYLTLLVSIVLIDSSDLWPSYYTIIPAVATFLIIAFNIDFKFLHSRGVQFFGDISYSLYL
ncbi:acyltransferase family protein [Aequorivita xiaoshiensis]|uniref:Acyltransferase n=1 Tax=Aequorivita xiaoshiensis TaxID=2874476 RepID=A0A9X1R1A0_9FLAO|nr:acyltransferase [Aequorivita xiaoshiensis]MCG2431658.1 acyltransferase [Aequorivita xiaoshiensis]